MNFYQLQAFVKKLKMKTFKDLEFKQHPSSITEFDMGVQARLMSQALRKITGAVSRSKTCVIFTNQLRSKIGIMFGNPETTPGGKALKF